MNLSRFKKIAEFYILTGLIKKKVYLQNVCKRKSQSLSLYN